MLALFTDIDGGLTVRPERMTENLERSHGLVFSQRVLLALIERGLSRQRAYELVQRNAMPAWDRREPFLDLLLADAEVTALLDEGELRALFDHGHYLRHAGATLERLGLA